MKEQTSGASQMCYVYDAVHVRLGSSTLNSLLFNATLVLSSPLPARVTEAGNRTPASDGTGDRLKPEIYIQESSMIQDDVFNWCAGEASGPLALFHVFGCKT